VSNAIEIIPLGGVGEFGSNCMAVRYGDDMILVDTGMGFPAESAYGVDVEVPTSTSSKSIATTSSPSSSRTATKTTSARFPTS
jgi:mRNA degradation ribonuclease J1/J2